MTSNLKWKSAEILKVFGSTLKQGTFIGGRATNSGTITKDEPTNFTPNYIANIYENITTHVPLFIDHGISDRKPIGYAFKFGVTETLDDIQYAGFVFNQQARNKIMIDGYDYVSPEIDEDNGMPHLRGIAFVRNPAISGTEVGAEIKVFSSVGTNSPNGDSNTMNDTIVGDVPVNPITTSTGTASSQPYIPTHPQPVVHAPTNVTNTPNLVDLSELRAEIAEYKAKFEQQSAKTEQLLTGQYNSVVVEMKSLGIEEPGKIVQGLPTEQKIAILSKLKDSLVKNKPMTSTTSTMPNVDDKTSENEKAFKEVVTELGLSEDQIKKLKGGS